MLTKLNNDNNNNNKNPGRKITIGILAHVDAGKTTLSEAILYRTGELRRLGRVDHRDAFLDDNEIERNRGITIFSKQARFSASHNGVSTEFTMIDTPGHVDFAPETERAMSVMDYALLVVSGSEGVQAHTRTLYRLLRQRNIPVFIFVNKMDIAVRSRQDILDELASELGAGAVDFGAIIGSGTGKNDSGDPRYNDPEAYLRLRIEDFIDSVTLYSAELADVVLSASDEGEEEIVIHAAAEMLAGSGLDDNNISHAIRNGEIVPCIFGSALRLEGTDALLETLARFTEESSYGDEFGARVYKVASAENGERLTFLKVTGGTLHTRDRIIDKTGEEKITQIRLYSGSKFVQADEASAGTVCAVTGLTAAPGDGLGAEVGSHDHSIIPYMQYTVHGPDGMDPYLVMKDLESLAEEDPSLNIRWKDDGTGIEVRIMGQVQLEVLQVLIRDRFGYDVVFGSGSVIYLETIADTYEGMGHFEPLRHYAEVHLILEPGERGSGIVITSDAPEDELARNWQRLIMTHIEEKQHIGTLIGAPLTDVRITLAAGRAHDKHTSGGDFREATYRAVRHALMQAREAGKAVLLEPWCEYDIELPSQAVGRAMTDIRQMGGTQNDLEQNGDVSRIRGRVPVSEISGYQQVLTGYTSAAGKLSIAPAGYDICHNSDEVTSEFAYDPERDTENTADSVFTSHGSSDIVGWKDAAERMHIRSVLNLRSSGGPDGGPARMTTGSGSREKTAAREAELRSIFERTYGPVKSRLYKEARTREMRPGRGSDDPRNQEIRARHEHKGEPAKEQPTIMIVDGYNLIFADQYLRELADRDSGSARDQLIDRLCNYAAYYGIEMTVVFDAYKVPLGGGSEEDINGIRAVYTVQDEPADIRIGKIIGSISGRKVYVVSSDNLVQQDAWGHGALRISSREFLDMLQKTEQEIRDKLQ